MAQRVLLGSAGLLVSKSGKSITSTVDSDFLINSNRAFTKPYVTGMVTSTSSSNTKTTITHNLGYIPVVVLFGPNDSNNYQCSAKISTTTIVITFIGSATYIIFRTQVV